MPAGEERLSCCSKVTYPFIFFPFLFGFLGLLVGIGSFVFWVLMLVDAIQRKFKEPNEKLIWVLIIIFAHIIGAILYYFLIKKKDKHRRK